jgi:DNA-binding response OmpR family regulator
MSPKLTYDVVSLKDVPAEDVEVVSGEELPVVLVVDDERVIADSLTIILSKSGFRAVTAYDGLQALELAARVRPKLLISDVMMPGMSGIELAIALTERYPECKVLLFSGQAATVDLLKTAREIGHDFTTLTKPVHPSDMLRRVSECLTGGDGFSTGDTKSHVDSPYSYQ